MQLRIRLVVAALLASAVISAQEASDEPITDELMRAIEDVALATLSFAETVRPAIDRSTFDQKSLIDSLDFDETEIVRFVAEDIAFEAYAGVLRGANGTLLAHAGNALDQSLFLATLLNDAGFEAVIRGGTLSADESQRLLRVLADRPELPAALDEAAVEEAQSRWLERFDALLDVKSREGREPAFTMEQVIEGIELDRDELLAALEAAGVVLGDDEAEARLMREVGEYFWVDYRLGPATPWIAAHPAFGGAAAPAVEAAVSYAGDIPAELTHRLRLELVVEQRIGSELTVAPLMAPMEFPSANVAGQSISLTLLPDTLLRTESADDGTSLEAETRFFFPLVNRGLPEGASALALNGTLVPPELIQLSQAGLFETVSAEFEAAASALSGLGSTDDEPEDLVAIESVRLKITLIHPTESERTIERILYQAPGESSFGDAADESLRRAAIVSELARSHSLGFIVGALSPAYVLDQTLAELEQLAPLIRAWADPALEACESLACLPQPELNPDWSGTNPATKAAFFDNEMPLAAGSVVYRDAMNVVRLSRPLFPDSSPVPGIFDIVSNARRAFRLGGAQPVPAPDLVLLAGVAETHLERIAPGARPLGSTIERQPGDRSASQLTAWADAPPLPPAALVETEMTAQALSSGLVVAMPDPAKFGADARLGWWEIDRSTGRTLGMGRYGGPAAEYIIPILLAVTVGSGMGMIANDCDQQPYYRRQVTVPARGGGNNVRRQKATYLSCAICGVRIGVENALASWGNTRRESSNAIQDCIGNRDGWVTESEMPESTRAPGENPLGAR